MNKLITKFKLNRAANARKWKHKDGGILKGLYGLITNVDRRRDTTGKGIGSMPFFSAAKFGSSDSPLALFYGSKEGGPLPGAKFGPQTGSPTILPGTVGKTGLNQYVLLMEKEAPNMFKLIAENPKSLKHLLSIGYGRIREGLKNFFKTGNKEYLKELEDWAKRNLNIFVNKGEPSSITSKGNLNYPSMENVDYTARGWTRPKLSSDQLWNGYIPEEFEGLEGIDRIITYHKKGGKAFHTGVNVLDSNPKISKAASKKVKKGLFGLEIQNQILNPNAMGGTAFTSWLNYLLKLPELLKLLKEKEQRELELKLQETAQRTSTIQSIIGAAGNFAMNKLGNLLNKKSTVDNGAPSKEVTINGQTINRENLGAYSLFMS